MAEAKRAYIVFRGAGVEVEVPDLPAGEPRSDDAAQEALDASPEFRATMERANQHIAAGETISAEELYREFGYTPPAATPPRRHTPRQRAPAKERPGRRASGR